MIRKLSMITRVEIAHHEAAHAIAAAACRWHQTVFVAIDPQERLDLLGVSRAEMRPSHFEQPYQLLILGAGGFVVAAAGWLAEHRLRGEALEWEIFHEEGCYCDPHQDEACAKQRLTEAAMVLGREVATMVMYREAETAAEQVVEACWPESTALAHVLDRLGRIEDVERYWTGEPLTILDRLCYRWCRRYGRTRPQVRDLAEHWRPT